MRTCFIIQHIHARTLVQNVAHCINVVTCICCLSIWCASACKKIFVCLLHLFVGLNVETVSIATAFNMTLVEHEYSAAVQHQHRHFWAALRNTVIVCKHNI